MLYKVYATNSPVSETYRSKVVSVASMTAIFRFKIISISSTKFPGSEFECVIGCSKKMSLMLNRDNYHYCINSH